MSVTTSAITPRNAVAIPTQNNPAAKPSKAEIQKHQNDLAYSILMSIGETLYGNTLKSESVYMINPKVNNVAAVHQVFDLELMAGYVTHAISELAQLQIDSSDKKMVSIFADKMDSLLGIADLYPHLFQFHAVQDPLLHAETAVAERDISALKDSKLIQYNIIKRVREASARNPEFFPKKSESCCIIQ